MTNCLGDRRITFSFVFPRRYERLKKKKKLKSNAIKIKKNFKNNEGKKSSPSKEFNTLGRRRCRDVIIVNSRMKPYVHSVGITRAVDWPHATN